MRHDRPECLKVKRDLLWPLQAAQISNICARLCNFFLSHENSWALHIKANLIKKLSRAMQKLLICVLGSQAANHNTSSMLLLQLCRLITSSWGSDKSLSGSHLPQLGAEYFGWSHDCLFIYIWIWSNFQIRFNYHIMHRSQADFYATNPSWLSTKSQLLELVFRFVFIIKPEHATQPL